MIDPITCNWCSTVTPIGSLIGRNTNQCPRCGNPTLPTPFQNLTPSTLFCCVNGGLWKKRDAATAICAKSDSAFKKGERQAFVDVEDVFPF